MRSDSTLDNRIEAFLKKEIGSKDIPSQTESCPSKTELADYLSGAIDPRKKQEISSHIISCERCFDIAALSLKALGETDKDNKNTLNALIKKTASASRKKSAQNTKARVFVKRNFYLCVAGVFFVLSFVFKQYFLQFLVGFAVFGLKWIMDTGGTKALIMIYHTWRTRNRDTGNDRFNRS
jgi:hypothetical protein